MARTISPQAILLTPLGGALGPTPIMQSATMGAVAGQDALSPVRDETAASAFGTTRSAFRIGHRYRLREGQAGQWCLW